MVADAGARVIELSDVSKVYESGELAVQALRSVSLVVREGEFVAIMGPSGSGKTTLLAILGCLDRPTSGSYKLVGEEMSTLDETRRAHVRGERIGFVFQAYNLLPRTTAYRNVELPLVYARVPAKERRSRVLAGLGEVGLSDREDHLPTQLSGGQRASRWLARSSSAQRAAARQRADRQSRFRQRGGGAGAARGASTPGATLAISRTRGVAERAVAHPVRLPDGCRPDRPGAGIAALGAGDCDPRYWRIASRRCGRTGSARVLTALGVVIGVASLITVTCRQRRRVASDRTSIQRLGANVVGSTANSSASARASRRRIALITPGDVAAAPSSP
jgi:ABC-type lipoprotein export system ATPase subunit